VELWISAETGAGDGFIRSAAAEEMTPWRAGVEWAGFAMGWEIQRGWQVPLIEMPSNSSLGQRGMTKLQPHTHACSSLHFGPPTCLYIRDDFDFWFGDDPAHSHFGENL